MNDLSGKVAIVTGGAQGIGKGITKHFLGLGMKVAMLDIDPEAGKETLDEFSGLGDVKFFKTDVGNETEVKELVEKTVGCFGGIYALINNAAIAFSGNTSPDKLALDYWDKVIRVNLTGGFLMAKHCIPHLVKTNILLPSQAR